ncbi:universal stress protein [Aquisalimonas asiatica]|uniref:Nucleotide-binding universal stress protein, UspA family n=1 Tax=Aquisalimonas asiatica TaxID=406100 RepID=A0A1H8S1Q2_9GAMM|nr:universal stress protein [Aquisalimonas asiatica]SEO72879.1 Nucleotide-binding universal stress protein, UspA family [Aquisalimonas asiatica]
MTESIKTILVPVDGSRHAAAGARYADRLARALGASVELLHAFPESPRALMERLGNTVEQAVVSRMTEDAFEAMRADSASRAFSRARSLLPDDAVAMTERTLAGDPANAVATHARASDAPMIVMGRRGLGRVREFLLGSVSEGVLYNATCPVTVVSDEDDVAGRVLVVPVDGSDPSMAAVRHAAMLAGSTGAAIHLLHVFPSSPREIPGVGGSMAEMAGIGPFSEHSFSKLADESAAKAFAQARERIGTAGIEVVDVRRGGDPATAINAYSREVGEGEVIIGARGLSRLENFLMGSVSRRVVHGAHCPVTIVH